MKEHDALIASKRKKGYADAGAPRNSVTKASATSTRAKKTTPADDPKASSSSSSARCVHIGHVSYNAHPAAPLVIGDFNVMKGWNGDLDGGTEGKVKIATGTVINLDLQLVAPDVFQIADDVVVLLAEEDRNKSLLKRYGLDELRPDIVGPAEISASGKLPIPSGAVVVSIAYNATPEAGADTSDLDPDAFREGERPALPKKVPSRPLWTDERTQRDLAVIPVKPGTYSIENGETPRFFRCTIRRVGE